MVTANVIWVVFESIIDMNNIKDFRDLKISLLASGLSETGAGVGSQCGPLVLPGLHA